MQLQGKAKLLKNESLLEEDEFKQLSEDFGKFKEETQKRVNQIKKDKDSWANSTDYANKGVNVDEELSEEEIGARFTKLKPSAAGND